MYDLIIIGGGPGGYVAAIRAAQLGLHTALVERDKVGGTCLNRGCIPTKTLLHTAKLFHLVQNSDVFGLHVSGVTLEPQGIEARKAEVVETLRTGVQNLLKGNKVEMFSAAAAIEAPGRVRVGEEVLETKRILIATGARPALPPIPGLDQDGVVTSDHLLDGPFPLYPSLTIIGGGVIGMEFASLYAALGCQVTVIEALDRILPTLDKELAQNLSMSLKKQGVTIHTAAKVERVDRTGEGMTCTFTAKDKTDSVTAAAVLVATGRRPNTDGLCAPGLDLGLVKGAIPVDGNFETAIPGIYAIGDVVAGNIQLAHVASAQGINAVSLMAGERPPMDLNTVPSCVYTSPEIACVGLTEAAAKEAGIPVRTGKYLMTGNGRSIIAGAGRGYIKVLAHADTGVVLGAQLLCERATDLVAEFTLAVSEGKTLEQLSAVIHPHPTFSEGAAEAVEAALGKAIHQLNR